MNASRLPTHPRIDDYALIGDARCAALLSRDGSLDWLCLPQFDRPSIFNRLLDAGHGGYWSIRPVDDHTIHRRYTSDTAVLETEFHTATGRVRVVDFMPVVSEEDKAALLLPFRSVVRRIVGVEGVMEMMVDCVPRPQDGRVGVHWRRRGRDGYVADVGGALLHLSGDGPLEAEAGRLTGRLVVRASDRRVFWLAYSEDAPAIYPLRGLSADLLHERTVAWWQQWAARCAYRGPHRARVVRSALTLKLLSFAPSNAMVAAATTSLPEVPGGERNWDYRYCWLRDAAYTAAVFFRLGYREEASGFVQWLSHATALTRPALSVVYDVYGRPTPRLHTLDHLNGYRGATPVRVGNQARDQYQLDVYGEVLDAVWLYVQDGGVVDRDMAAMIRRSADYVAAHWPQPDHGIWEIPGLRRHYVHSKVMCWAALDRAIRLTARLGLRGDPLRWEGGAAAIQARVMREGTRPRAGFVQTLGGESPDAAALLFPLVGFIEAGAPQVVRTVETIERRLAADDLVYRYRLDDGLPGDEGTFVACAFWRVEALWALDRRADAAAVFERLQRRANDVGLYAEEMAATTGDALGNFPQALSHLAHISAALRIAGVTAPRYTR